MAAAGRRSHHLGGHNRAVVAGEAVAVFSDGGRRRLKRTTSDSLAWLWRRTDERDGRGVMG